MKKYVLAALLAVFVTISFGSTSAQAAPTIHTYNVQLKDGGNGALDLYKSCIKGKTVATATVTAAPAQLVRVDISATHLDPNTEYIGYLVAKVGSVWSGTELYVPDGYINQPVRLTTDGFGRGSMTGWEGFNSRVYSYGQVYLLKSNDLSLDHVPAIGQFKRFDVP